MPSSQMAPSCTCSRTEDTSLLRLSRLTWELGNHWNGENPRKSRLPVTLLYGANPCLLAYPTRRLVPAFDAQMGHFPTHGRAMAELDQLSAKRARATASGIRSLTQQGRVKSQTLRQPNTNTRSRGRIRMGVRSQELTSGKEKTKAREAASKQRGAQAVTWKSSGA